MTTESERQIRELLETRTRAFGRRDAATAAGAYHDDLVLYDLVGPFVRRDEDPADRLQRWMASYRTAIGHEIRDLEITAGADLAFCHFLVRISGTMRDGTEVGMWVRATTCLRREGDGWTIVHEHASVPFDPDTGRAVLRGAL
ncbi:nuclear transport factor 2 family protein [Solwaraspora sp. WMMD1047]|uniref:YybH family protein n=1 Tax=Solwaraspora sp. WMMD1047 TaxID=3016102 RepID=UPI002417AFE4|nr:nuclear transport factor 2 family protein [Solwaraspora sp. WMMD1047]MDG4830097.1 nuclear transport factor 2 family protein [Solwaraspora sp. WMMD1047]